MEVRLNTLYVLTQGAYVHRDHQTVKIEVERQTRFETPIHHLESIAVFGNVMVSPGLLALCADAGIAVSFLTETGRLLARVDAPQSGNVLLRRRQFRLADDSGFSLRIAKCCIAGKLQNARLQVLRAAREAESGSDAEGLKRAAGSIGERIEALEAETSLDGVRGQEGDAARTYFQVFSLMIKQQRETFAIAGRNRRPPLDRTNALLSYIYSVLLHDCVSALASAGLDPSVGFLHEDRPGRPSLALDLMEEFRTLIADRLVLTLINRQQVSTDDFVLREGGAVELKEESRKAVIRAYQERKQAEVKHPILNHALRVGQLPFVQAKLLARTIRGDLPDYPSCVLR